MSRLNFFQNRPKVEKIDVASYLSYLQVQRKQQSLSYLKELQRAHLLRIPFENLDVHYGNQIKLDYSAIFRKVVQEKRGGFCYELNGLFYHLLYNLGFNCYVISARVFDEHTNELGKEFDHLVTLVTVDDEQFLVDVGFGDGPTSPIKIDFKGPQMDYTRYWMIDKDPDGNLILKESSDTRQFTSKYLFTIEERQLIEFMEMCEYHQTSNESIFTQKKLITKLTATGRVTLTDRKIRILSLGAKEEWPVMNEDEFLSKLQQHFGITFQQLTTFKEN